MTFDFRAFDAPIEWLVCFHVRAVTWWVKAMPGRYKHVSAIGMCPRSRVWVGFDPAIDRTRIWVVPDGPQVNPLLGMWVDDAKVVAMPPGPGGGVVPGLWCVPMVARLIGLRSGALRPDTLLRDCLRNGGTVLAEELDDGDEGPEGCSAPAGSAARDPAAAGPAAEDGRDPEAGRRGH